MLNRVFLIGNMTRDPESRIVGEKNTAVTTFGLAVNDGYGDRKKTYFFDVECWGKTAENMSAYGGKGKQIVLEGSLKVDTWQDKESGQNRSKVMVKAEKVSFVGPKKDDASASDKAPDEDVPF